MSLSPIPSRLTRVIFRSGIVLVLLLGTLHMPAHAKKQNLRLKSEKVSAPLSEKNISFEGNQADSVMLEHVRNLIKFRGFDKNASSARETFYVINESDIDILAISLVIQYLDMSGRMLHRREETIPVNIPAGETRMVTLRSIDTQRSLYYHKSKPPRKGGMPFEVAIYLDKLYFNE